MLNESNICFPATMTTSSGVWLGDRPFDYAFPILLAQLTVIFIATRISHTVLGPIGLPKHICHIIGGIALGPTGLSANRKFQETIFPDRSLVHLDHISHIAFILFIFVVAVKTDLGLIRKPGAQAIAVAHAGTVVPFLFIFVAIFFHPSIYAQVPIMHNSLQLANRWAITSNIVTAYYLAEFRLLTSKLGRLAMSASLIADFYWVILSAGFLFATTMAYHSALRAFTFLGSFLAFVGLIWLFAKPVALWIIRHTPEGSAIDSTFFLTIMLMAIGSSLAGQLIGQSMTLGPLLLGVIIPGGPPLGTAVVDRLDRLVSELFLPGYLILAGLRSNLHAVLSGVLWGAMTSFIAISVVGKVCGVVAICLYYKMSFRDAFILSIILNGRGILEISTLNNLKDFHELTEELYAINIIGIIVVGGISGILLKALYPPSAHLEAYRRRTVEACAGAGELRILTCVHGEDHVPPLLTLVNTISPTASSPLCIYLLHLSPLAGRSNTILAPYKKKQCSKRSFRALSGVSAAAAAAEEAPAATVADRIVNSFISLARHHPAGLVAIQPFISVSPYATMHDDVCSLAVDKMCDLILVPFHRSMSGDVPLESVNPAVRSFNVDILLYAPCSVAILVNRGLIAAGGGAAAASALDSRRVLILFLGGADDREALSIAARMIENPSIGIYVLRLVAPGGGKGDPAAEEEMDDAAVEDFRSRGEGLDRVEYREEEVEEGAETVRLMKEMDGICDLLIVGRGEGRSTPFTSGLEIWSEYPELGVLGDVLASPDFGGSFSVMVVQQRSTVAGDEGGGLLRRAGSVQSSKMAPETVDARV